MYQHAGIICAQNIKGGAVMYMINSRGPNFEPCVAPQRMD